MVRRPVRQVQAVAGPQRSPPQARAGKCRPMARCTPRSSPAEQATSISPAARSRSPPKIVTLTQALYCHRIAAMRSEEHTSELQSLMRISYAVFCLKKKTKINTKYKLTDEVFTSKLSRYKNYIQKIVPRYKNNNNNMMK